MREVVRTEFGEVLRRIRLQCGMTQQALADALHIHRATYSYYEIGKTQPDFQQLGKIAKIFGVSQNVLSSYLAAPEKLSDWQVPQRAPKKIAKNPVSFGQLCPEEKSLIALFRLCDENGRRTVAQAAQTQSRKESHTK